MKGQAVLYTAAGIGGTLLCLLGVNWVGPAGAFMNLFTPLFAAYLSLRFDLKSGIVVVVVSSLLLLQLATLYTLVAYLGLFGIGSLALPLMLRRGVSWDRAVLYSGAVAALATLVMMLVAAAVTGTNVQGLIDQAIQTEVEQAMQVYRDSGFTDAQLQEIQAVTRNLAEFVANSFYGLYVAVVMAVQFLCLMALQLLGRNRYRIKGVAFDQWRLPQTLIWLLIAAGFALLVPVDIVARAGYSLLVILLPLYFLQGMAVVNSFLKRKPYPPLVKGLIYTLLLLLNPLPLVVTSVGVFDLWVDFRRPRQKKN
jgi:uncharacterized protein YybS (DUF2232 family)